jgi:glutamine synthetase adenylyltransferase
MQTFDTARRQTLDQQLDGFPYWQECSAALERVLMGSDYVSQLVTSQRLDIELINAMLDESIQLCDLCSDATRAELLAQPNEEAFNRALRQLRQRTQTLLIARDLTRLSDTQQTCKAISECADFFY